MAAGAAGRPGKPQWQSLWKQLPSAQSEFLEFFAKQKLN